MQTKVRLLIAKTILRITAPIVETTLRIMGTLPKQVLLTVHPMNLKETALPIVRK